VTTQRVTRGAPLLVTPDDFNQFAAAANAQQNREGELLQSNPATAITSTRTLLVSNDTGTDLPQYAIVGLGNSKVTFDEDNDIFLERVISSGQVPDLDSHRGRFAVLLEPAAAGAVVSAAVEGLVQVKVDDAGQGGLRTAEIVHGSTDHLELIGYGSAAIVYRPGGAGAEWCVVKLGTAPVYFPVELQASGGAQGTDSTPATWRYNVLDVGQRVLLTNIDPTVSPHQARRPDWGAVNQATAGVATILSDQVIVALTDEVWQPDLKYEELSQLQSQLAALQSQVNVMQLNILNHESRIYALEHP